MNIEKNTITAFVIRFYIDSKMSAVLLKLTGGGTVHGIRSPDGTYTFSVYDFIEVVCHKTRKFANIHGRT